MSSASTMTFPSFRRIRAALEERCGQATRALNRLASGLGIQPRSALIWTLAVALAIGGAVTLLTVRHTRARSAAQRELIAIADQRVNRLVDWRKERLADGRYFSSARFAARSVVRWLAEPESEAARAEVLDWLGSLQGEERYYEVMVFDERLERHLALPPEAAELTAIERDRLAEVRRSGEVVMSDLERAGSSGRISCNVLFPVFGGIDRRQPPVAIGLLRANARASLFPMLQRWPVPSETAETLLVRREGGDVLFLNDLRHRADTALSLRQALEHAPFPAARVLRGTTTPFEGIDYRGERVVAVGRLVPGTPWAVVAKVDQREIYGPVRWQLLAESTLLASALLAGGMVVTLVWQKRRSSLLRRAAQEWERTFDSVPDLIAIVDDQNRIIRVNRAMAERIGCSPEECAGALCFECMHGSGVPPDSCPHVQTANDQQTHSAEVSNPRLGGEFHVTTVPLFDDRGALTGVVHVARDITERKRAEAALRQSEALLQKALEAPTVGVLFFRLNRRINRANATFERMCGYASAELAELTHWETLSAPEFWAANEHAAAELAETGATAPFEKQMVRKDGTRWWGVFAPTVLSGRGREAECVEFVLDVTERRRAEEAVRDSEERFRSLTFATSHVVWVMSCDGRVSSEEDNRSWQAFTGQLPGQMLGDGWLDAIHPDDRAKVGAAWQQAIETLSTYAVDYRLRRHDGEYRWMEAHGVPVSGPDGNLREWVGTSSDVTERKQAEEKLRSSELKYRAVFEQAAIGIGRVSFADARWMDVNETFCRMLGYSPAEMRATPWPQITWPADVDLDLPLFRRLAAGELDSYSVEKRFIHQQGHHVWARLTLSLVRDIQGRPDYEVAIIEDITERVRAEDSLKASLREKEVMLKEIHHRVKNNMQVLSSLVNLQARALGSGSAEQGPGAGGGRTDDEVVLAAFADLRDRVRSMAMVHEKLYQSENLAAVDFAAYAESLLKNLWKAHRTGVAINLKLALEPVALTVDQAVPCGLILNELASNTLKHAFRGRSEGTVTVSSHANDARIAICVSDDGVGLPTGLDWQHAPSLGLQLVQMLSRQLRASVEVRPSGQGGTEFELSFDRVR